MRVVEHNARQIERYLEWVWHLIEKSLMMPEEPPDRKHKGGARWLLSDAQWKLILENRAATAHLEPIIQEAKRTEARFSGVYFSDLINEVTYRPDAVAKFRTMRGVFGYEGKRARAFFKMCRLFADGLREYDGPGGGFVLSVKTTLYNAEDDPRRVPGGKPRTHAAQDSYRRMVEEMESMVLSGTHSKEGAKAAKADELMCSMGRIKDAITFVNKERTTVFDRENGEAA